MKNVSAAHTPGAPCTPAAMASTKSFIPYCTATAQPEAASINDARVRKAEGRSPR